MTKPHLKFLYSIIKPYKNLLIAEVFLAVFWAFMRYVDPWAIRNLIDSLACLQAGNSNNSLFQPLMWIILVITSWHLSARLSNIIWYTIKPKLRLLSGKKLLERTIKNDYRYHKNTTPGKINKHINNVLESLPEFIELIIDRFWTTILALIVSVLTLSTINIKLGLLISLNIIIFVFIIFFSYKEIILLNQKFVSYRASLSSYFINLFYNISNVQFFNGEKKEKLLVQKHLYRASNAEKSIQLFMIKRYLLQGFCFIGYQVVSMYILANNFMLGKITAGDFIFVIRINTLIIMRLWNILKDVTLFFDYSGKISQALNILLVPIEVKDKKDAILSVKRGAISFHNVSFTYPNGSAIFTKKSITINPGEKVGLIGYSGGGKTTFVQLILRLFDPQSGTICIDNQDISTISKKSLRESIAIVPQDNILFNRSIMDNIQYANPMVKEAEIIKAAKRAGADAFIRSLPYGYSTMVGELGNMLSGGQKQRICIARALVKKSNILILDEAMAQLDLITEEKIRKTINTIIEEEKVTMLVIAHRLYSLVGMDRILVFGKNNIVQDGNHRQLIKEEGVYKTFWDEQMKGLRQIR